jgi:TniQ
LEFLFSIPFSSDEWLSSYFTRLSKRNRYATLTAVENLCRQHRRAEGITDTLERPILTQSYDVISTITGLSPDRLYAGTVHRFAPILQPPGKSATFLALTSNRSVPLLCLDEMRRHLRSKNAAQFCPACLREHPYHRLIWVPLAVTACLVHNCLLVNLCPCCHSPVTTQSISTANCQRCMADLSATPCINLEGDSTGIAAQSVLQALLLGKGGNDTAQIYNLPEQHPAVIYYFLYGLQSTLGEARGLWPTLDNSDNFTSVLQTQPSFEVGNREIMDNHRRYTIAFSGITNWPDGFRALLSVYCQASRTAGEKELFHKMGNLYAYWIEQKWRHPAFRFVHDAFNGFLADIYGESPWIVRTQRFKEDGKLADQLGYFSVMDAAWRLQVSVEKVRELIEEGHLTTYRGSSPYDFAAEVFVLRSEVYALQKRDSGEWGNQNQ